MSSVYYDDNTGYIILDELRDSEATFVNNATVVCLSIRTLDGETLLTGPTYPIAMPYVSGSNGKYRGVVPDTLGGVPNETVVAAHVRATVGTDVANFHLRFPMRIRVI